VWPYQSVHMRFAEKVFAVFDVGPEEGGGRNGGAEKGGAGRERMDKGNIWSTKGITTRVDDSAGFQ